MGLSSNILWHQAKKDGLKGIIRDRCLYYSYSEESVISSLAKLKTRFAFPMISVCDLPLSETGGYLKKYGDYTIGFSSAWGKRNGFSTVWYCDEHSNTLLYLLRLFADKFNLYYFDTGKDVDYQRIIYLLSYVKQYEGPLPKKNYKRYRFYDEREQRRVPSFEDLSLIGEKQFIINYEDYKKGHNNSPLLPKALNIPFEWEDVRYIIVEKNEEKDEVMELVKKSSNRDDLRIMYLTNKEVREDVIGLSHDVKEDPIIITSENLEEIADKLRLPIIK